MTEVISGVIDLRPLFEQVVFPLATVALAPIAAWATQRIGRLAHVQMNQKQADLVEQAIYNGIQFALSRAKAYAGKNAEVVTKNEMVATAANYVIPKIPGAIKSLGITEKGLKDRIEARLVQHLEVPDAGNTASNR